jgi:hypothetical protein
MYLSRHADELQLRLSRRNLRALLLQTEEPAAGRTLYSRRSDAEYTLFWVEIITGAEQAASILASAIDQSLFVTLNHDLARQLLDRFDREAHASAQAATEVGGLTIIVEADLQHYAEQERLPGMMHPNIERALEEGAA